DDADPVADDDAVLAQLAGAHRGHLDRRTAGTAHAHGHPPAVDGDHQPRDGVGVGRPGAGARPGAAAAGPDPDVVLVRAAAEAATAVSTSWRACSRSVSCPRRWATPVSRERPSASAHSAASTGVSSPTSPRSATRGATVPLPVTVNPSGPRVTSAPIAVSSR